MNKHDIFITGGYSNELTLLRVNKDLSSMSKQEFVTFLREAIESAQCEYDEIIEVYNVDYIAKCKSGYRDSLYRMYDNKLKSYKRESSKKKLIAQIEEEAAKYEVHPRNSRIFFDTMPMCHDNSINNSEILTVDSKDRDLEYVYDAYEHIINHSSGVVFKYDITGTDEITTYSFRPWMEFIIPEDEMNELKKKKREIDARIQKFYDSLRYKGD